ncbi:hypothetical protein FACS189487_04000 [Campylobacterota bacterium]|nr:hypothetical protein FACS189487_04000 [Campylobacterota bacterium]
MYIVYIGLTLSISAVFFAIWLNAKYGIEKVETLSRAVTTLLVLSTIVTCIKNEAPAWMFIAGTIGFGLGYTVSMRSEYEKFIRKNFGYKDDILNSFGVRRPVPGYFLYILIGLFMQCSCLPIIIASIVAPDA